MNCTFYKLVTSYDTFLPYLCIVKQKVLTDLQTNKKFYSLNSQDYDTYSLSRSNRIT